ncbi:unnamed protein product [Miscanthus lutarioriparius]|uniref:4-hydroxy-7-methoxy-3-oxo-3,4-dihydro-2H-1,4-benzoxazin-2-yl glucosidebeta-D-glucosidase n=1 Tax=Miscanthus lutarioriparius TaxID=422564 RepID=A0A811N955_9POAL|nr:unnamed protein product [Miscanthus lutarioriparius]
MAPPLVSSSTVLRCLWAHNMLPRLLVFLLAAVIVVPRSAYAITWRDLGSSSAQGPRLSRWKGQLQRMGEHPAFGTPSPMKEDVKLMHEMGLDAYRFSIAWPRLIPDGRGKINPKGLEYYNNLIDELILHGIQPHATIYHFDLPQVLQDEYSGLLSPRFIEDYLAFAEICFRSFGDRVKHWVTVNKPNIEPIGAFDTGTEPPRRCSYPFGENCTGGNSSTEPYIAAHHLLLAHAAAVSLYKGRIESPPWALGKLLEHLRLNYGNPPVMFHENGLGDTPGTPSAIEYDDEPRIEFLQDYLEERVGRTGLLRVIVWSFLDVFEFIFAYRMRFGLCGVDMNAGARTRYLRSSAR